MKKRVQVGAVIALALLNVLVVWIVVEFRDRPGKRLPVADLSAELVRKREVNTAFHREKAKAATAVIAEETVDELVEKLVDDEQASYPGINLSHGRPQACWEWSLMSRRVWRLLAECKDLEPVERAKIVDRAFDHALSLHKTAFEVVRQSYLDPQAPKNEQSMLATKLGICRSLFLAAKCQSRSDLFKKIDAVRTYAREEIDLFETTDFPIKEEFIRNSVKNTGREDGEPDNAFYVNIGLYVCPHEEREALIEAAGLKRLLRTRMIQLTAWNAEPGSYDFAQLHRGESYKPSDVVESIEMFEWNGNSIDGIGVQEAAVAKLLTLVRDLPERPKQE
jgi:hypothetical protein